MGARPWATAKSPARARGWTREVRAVNFRDPREDTKMYKLYYAPGTCALASHIALEEAGADYTAERLDFKANQQQSPEYLKINVQGPGAVAGDRQGRHHRDAGDPRLHRADLPEGEARAARRRLCVCAGAVVQQLPLRHRACGACPQGTRLSLGDGRIFLCRHETHGAEEHGRLFRADREGDAEGTLGDGRAVHDLRRLSLHHRALARGRRRRSQEPAAGCRSHEAHVGTACGEEGHGPAAGQGG